MNAALFAAIDAMDDEEVLARTIFGEARGEPLAGKAAVASVVMNRLRVSAGHGSYWWGNTVRDICLKPNQFSAWNESDPNFQTILSATKAIPVFSECAAVAGIAVLKLLKDNTKGSTHYHALRTSPEWAAGRIHAVRVGRHFFYNDIE